MTPRSCRRAKQDDARVADTDLYGHLPLRRLRLCRQPRRVDQRHWLICPHSIEEVSPHAAAAPVCVIALDLLPADSCTLRAPMRRQRFDTRSGRA